ncbi:MULTISPECIES: helix-turn-helix domain-containing protein [Flavobacteriaceae]|uniref:helix-turn-helix domain-containing protein n=1 Tax=Flavobacteriaceae TaxID=49546 RepID=UPI003A92543D
MEIGTAVKNLRKNKGLSQKVLAEMCNISANAMNQIENNTSFPHKNTIDKICDALEIPVSYLLFFSISEDDIPQEKKIVFNSLNDAVKSVLLNE